MAKKSLSPVDRERRAYGKGVQRGIKEGVSRNSSTYLPGAEVGRIRNDWAVSLRSSTSLLREF
jgi:hypothetical protein